MASEWYYHEDGDPIGPISAEELKQLVTKGRLCHHDMIWKDGLADWIAAGTVKGLFSTPPIIVEDNHASVAPVAEKLRPKQYKVLSQKDKWFTGKFDPAVLEEALNSYSQQGWILKAAATATIGGFGGAREEMIMILER